MVKLKKPIDYINDLRSSPNIEISKLGETLYERYCQWTRSLRLKDMLEFLRKIQDNREKIGIAQLFGKFRAYSFEEFVYRLIQAEVEVPRTLGLYWGEKCLVWKESDKEYGIEIDILTGKKLNRFIEPVVAVDAKIELDASRLKTALASFLILKRCNPNAKCFLVHILGEVHPLLLELMEPWIDGIYQFSEEKDETVVFVKSVQAAVKQF